LISSHIITDNSPSCSQVVL